MRMTAAMTRPSPFGHPFLLGFDEIEQALDRVAKGANDGYPPYNIERLPRTEREPERLRITLAVAGFTRDQLDVMLEDSQLVVRGRQVEERERHFLHRGIAARTFRQTFNLADHVKVVGANLENGLLTVELKREVPEALKPRRIAIGGVTATSGQDNAPAQITESKVAQAKAAEPRVAEAA